MPDIEEKIKKPPDESSVRWLISYADFMMQLVCLFILMYSVSSIAGGEWHEVLESYRRHIGIKGPPPKTSIPSVGLSLQVVERPIFEVEKRVATLGSDVYGKRIKIVRERGGLRITFEDVVMFKIGSFILTPEGVKLVQILSNVLGDMANPINIEGFTSRDKEDSIDGDHKLLSAMRAREVGNVMKGIINPSRITLCGMGKRETGRVEIFVKRTKP
jgi:chemotaxis protein MotB